MNGWQSAMNWMRIKRGRIPVEYKDSFYRETGSDNLIRLRLSCLVLAAMAVLFLLKPGFFAASQENFSLSPSALNSIFLGIVLVIFGGAEVINSKIAGLPVWLVRLPVLVFAVTALWWACFIGSFFVMGLNPTVSFMIGLFLLYLVFILSFSETVGILLNGLLAFYWLNFSSEPLTNVSFSTWTALLLFSILGVAVSMGVFNRRLSAFLNWENISSMNSSLKWEIKQHQQTLRELEAIRNDLDRQVSEKTSFLRDTNLRLQEEIAERSYADKVRMVLYRISGFVNQNASLTDVIRHIHEQLKQILDVTNFLVGTYDTDHFEIEPVYQENSTESFTRYRLGRTLSSYVIRHKRSLLLNRQGIRDLAAGGEVEIVGVPAHSWLGVPLMVEDRVVGIVMVQSYKPEVTYDQADLQLLEYVSEHLALAIDRHEVQARLIRAKEQAEESDRLKSAFLSNLSHEIRTPMNAIVGFSEMMAESDLTDQERQLYTARVLDNGNRLLNTLTKMMDLAKLQAHQMSVDIQDIAIERLIDSFKADIQPLIVLFKKSHLEIRYAFELKSEQLLFKADPQRFRQLLLCLTENAVKFTESGFIELGCRKYDQRQLLFWVRDTGIGMNDTELEHVFEWFIKGQKASENLIQGTGLGLTITKLLIELMNGQVWAESEPGKGSCFFFTLPLVTPDSIKLVPELRNPMDSAGFERKVTAV